MPVDREHPALHPHRQAKVHRPTPHSKPIGPSLPPSPTLSSLYFFIGRSRSSPYAFRYDQALTSSNRTWLSKGVIDEEQYWLDAQEEDRRVQESEAGCRFGSQELIDTGVRSPRLYTSATNIPHRTTAALSSAKYRGPQTVLPHSIRHPDPLLKSQHANMSSDGPTDLVDLTMSDGDDDSDEDILVTPMSTPQKVAIHSSSGPSGTAMELDEEGVGEGSDIELSGVKSGAEERRCVLVRIEGKGRLEVVVGSHGPI